MLTFNNSHLNNSHLNNSHLNNSYLNNTFNHKKYLIRYKWKKYFIIVFNNLVYIVVILTHIIMSNTTLKVKD